MLRQKEEGDNPVISIYTDKARLERYSVLLQKKSRCEKVFAVCLGIYAFIMAAELIGGVCSYGISMGLVLNEAADIKGYHLLPNLLAFSLGLAGILFREWKLSLAGAAGILLVAAEAWLTKFQIGLFGFPLLLAAAAAGFQWAKLKKEEGFPRFQIDYEELQAREKSQVSYIQHRALEQGVRTEQQALDPQADMTDLTAQPQPSALPAMLQGYHERGAGSDPVVAAPVPHFDRIQTISPEDVGGLDAL